MDYEAMVYKNGDLMLKEGSHMISLQKGGSIFENLAVPAGLVLLQHKMKDTVDKEPFTIYDEETSETSRVIEESLYDKLLGLAEAGGIKINKTGKRTRKNRSKKRKGTRKNIMI